MLNLAGSGHDFRGVCFSVAYTTPNGKSCRTFPKTRSIYHNSRCTPPLKRPQSLSGAKNAKRQENTRPNQKNASESFSGRCITMHESDVRSVSCVLNTDKFSPLVRGALTGFPVSKLHISPGQKKTDLGSVARIRVYGKYFSYRMLNIHKRKKCLSDALKQPFQKESALYDARKR